MRDRIDPASRLCRTTQTLRTATSIMRAMFFLVALSIWIAMNGYVLFRIVTLPAFATKRARLLVTGAGVLAASAFVLSRLVDEHVSWTIASAMEWIGAQWMGAVFIALVCFLVVDIVTAFGSLMPRRAPTARTWAAIVALILTLVAFGNAMRPPVVRHHEIQLDRLPADLDGTVVVAVSDLHVGRLTGEAWLRKRVDQIMQLDPDMVVLAGDLIEDSIPGTDLADALSRIDVPLGAWAVRGNHETDQMEAIMRAGGIALLRDQAESAAPGLVVGGVDTRGHRERSDPGDALGDVPTDVATILISHYPSEVAAAASLGTDLMISGHTHDGQIWPFRYLVRTSYPWIAGRYEVDGMTLVVCRGTGTWGPTMRLWRPSEILRIVLRSGR